jgi:hypothetical protein
MLKKWLAMAAYRCEVAGTSKDIIDLKTLYFEFENERDIEPALVNAPIHSYNNEAGDIVRWLFSRLLIVWEYDRAPKHGEEFGGVHVSAAEIAALASEKGKGKPCVFVLHHEHHFENGNDDAKLLGVYASREDAQLQIDELYKHQPGFNLPNGGFSIDCYEINKNQWTEGFATIYHGATKDRTELLALMPKKKTDLESARAIVDLGFPMVEPILDEMLVWLQDINRPVNRVFQPFLATLGEPLVPYIQAILDTNDDIWKHWIIQEIIGKSTTLSKSFRPQLLRMANEPTPNERKEEVHLIAEAVLLATVAPVTQTSNPTRAYRFFRTDDEKVSSIIGCLADKEVEQRKLGQLDPKAELLWEITGYTYEEVMAVHNLRMGFGPYNPTGESVACPTCNAHYYPLGSGECWHCGKLC